MSTTALNNISELNSSSLTANLFAAPAHAKIVRKQPTQFATALAHEIRNPLSNISLAAEMLKASMLDDEQKLCLDIIIRGADRIDRLVYDLLSYYQVDKMQFEKHYVHELLDEVLVMTADRISLKNICIEKDYTKPDCKIVGDKQKIKIAFTNIIINAIDAMPAENGVLHLAIKSKSSKCVIEIEDNGMGISNENIGHIFKPYFTSKPGGMGLGLSTTLDILQSNHIGVDVQSEEGRGTCFILSFNKAQ
jgi:signal transduction histidine kinase